MENSQDLYKSRPSVSKYHDDKKKKHKRRRRKHNKTLESNQFHNPLTICFTPQPLSNEEEETLSKQVMKKKGSSRINGPVLRPVGAQVPRAPNNSTQFIMDDHENSTLFMHFNRDEMDQQRKKEQDESGNSPYPPSDWLPYNTLDFQTTYQSAREDEMMNTSRDNLHNAILSLEAKAAHVSSLLAASPSRLLAQLQSQLLKLQEDNAYLTSQISKKKHHIENCQAKSSSSSSSSGSSSSSSGTESDSDSTQSSSSACSDPDCNTCTQERHDEEKENTRPGDSIQQQQQQQPEETVSNGTEGSS